MKDIPNEAVIYIKGVIVDENQVVFNNKFVKNVTENNIIVANPAEERRNKTIKIINLVCVGVGTAAVLMVLLVLSMLGGPGAF